MGTVRFYCDEHIAKAVVKGLRERSADVRTVSEAGLTGASDLQQLEYALAQGRVVVTMDADFLRLHEAGVRHAGVVYFSRELPIGELVRGLMLIHQVLDAEEMSGHIEFL